MEKASLIELPFSSGKEFLEEKRVLGSILIYSAMAQRVGLGFSGLIILYSQRPPSRKSISLV